MVNGWFSLRFWFVVAVSGLIGMLAGGVGTIVASGPPIRLLDVRPTESGPGVHPGDRLELILTVQQGDARPIVVDRELWRWTSVAGVKVKEHMPLQAGAAVLDQETRLYVLSLGVPPNTQPGQWYYKSRAYYACPFIGPAFACWKVMSADVPVTVLPR